MPGVWDIGTVLLTMGVILIGTVFASLCYMKGVHLIGAVKSVLFGCVEPLTATVCAALILDQTFRLPDILGMACIIVGVMALAVQDVLKSEKE